MITWYNKIHEPEEMNGKEVYYLNKNINFKSIDGYINFMIQVNNYKLSVSKNQVINKYLQRLNEEVSKLQSKNTYMKKREIYNEYKERISNVFKLEPDYTLIMNNIGRFEKFSSEKYSEYIENGKPENKNVLVIFNDIGKVIDFKEYVLNTLTKESNRMSLSNVSNGKSISDYGCHIEVVVAINILFGTMNYVNNSFSNKLENEIMGCDKMHIESNIDYAKGIVGRVRNLVT